MRRQAGAELFQALGGQQAAEAGLMALKAALTSLSPGAPESRGVFGIRNWGGGGREAPGGGEGLGTQPPWKVFHWGAHRPCHWELLSLDLAWGWHVRGWQGLGHVS